MFRLAGLLRNLCLPVAFKPAKPTNGIVFVFCESSLKLLGS